MIAGPDGLEERTAFYDEAFSTEDRDDGDTDQALESDLMDLAEAKMLSWAFDRIMR